MSEQVRLRLEGPLARITLARPPLNVLTTAMMRDLADTLLRVSGNDEVHVVRLDAVGKAFCAGVDVGEHQAESIRPMTDALRALFEALHRAPVPTVSVVHGAALGGGCEVVLGTDLCLASERASFGQPEIRLGVFAPPASVLLPRIAGERRALSLLLTGETLSASDALAFGIVNRVFPESTFEQDVEAWIARLLDLSASALRMAKRAVVAARGLRVEDAHRALEGIYPDELMRTEDASEGLRAFLEKRPPRWKHR